jgi:hypothetical protein
MAYYGELVVAEVPREGDHIVSHRSLGGSGVLRSFERQDRSPVAAQVWAGDEEGVR